MRQVRRKPGGTGSGNMSHTHSLWAPASHWGTTAGRDKDEAETDEFVDRLTERLGEGRLEEKRKRNREKS